MNNFGWFIVHRSSFIVFLAAFVAGVMNAIAGGGTLISFPALIWLGRSPILANATNAAALWPGSFASMFGYRKDLAAVPRWLYWLILPSIVGAAAGAILLLHTPTRTFNNLVPWLILGATLMLAFQEMITKYVRIRGGPAFVIILQFIVSIYGGYFGAGMGILMLAALGLIGMTDLHQMNGLKNLLAIFINGVAAIYFAMSGAVIWSDAILMAVAAVLGGFAGAKLALRLGHQFVRAAIVVIGLGMTIALFVKR